MVADPKSVPHCPITIIIIEHDDLAVDWGAG